MRNNMKVRSFISGNTQERTLRKALLRCANNRYDIEVHENINRRFDAIFRKDGKSYYYVFIDAGFDFQFIVKDHESHHQLIDIFGPSFVNEMNTKIKRVALEFNFIHEFCFGKKTTFNCQTLTDVAEYTTYNYMDAIRYNGVLLKDAEPKFSATFFLHFNLDKLMFYSDPTFAYFESAFVDEPSISVSCWNEFKKDFLKLNGASKIDKHINDLVLSDGFLLPMINY